MCIAKISPIALLVIQQNNREVMEIRLPVAVAVFDPGSSFFIPVVLVWCSTVWFLLHVPTANGKEIRFP